MRGKPDNPCTHSTAAGITPADAGKTSRCRCCRCRCWDHPRGCGENPIRDSQNKITRGSPPRMRGKLCQELHGLLDRGITPADAGKTNTCPDCYTAAEDHPRGCGENARKDFSAARYEGSPPRMRGKLKQTNGRLSMTRITPADAGKTQSGGRGLLLCRDHPRGCGENAFGLSQALSLSGSPPRMRGKR